MLLVLSLSLFSMGWIRVLLSGDSVSPGLALLNTIVLGNNTLGQEHLLSSLPIAINVQISRGCDDLIGPCTRTGSSVARTFLGTSTEASYIVWQRKEEGYSHCLAQ